ncbi:hypothetical protein [Streptococcus pluranimalium]|uniref:hypothetical protein n=1 Tax=Streptococcus pluranimalium TaxID=82348 RepID=UPI0039FC77B4
MNKFPFREVAKRLDELEGLTIHEMIEVLGTSAKKVGTLKSGLYTWRRKGKISFVCKNKRFYDFKLTDSKLTNIIEDENEKIELSQIKIKLYVQDVINMAELADNPAIKATERIKATENKQRALKHLEDKYALQVLKSYGLTAEL